MISIIVTHKKDLDFLSDCLDSIAAQKYKDIETILVLDNTQDDVSELVNKHKDAINLSVYELENGTGVSAARNLGLEKATGDYVTFLDNDDFFDLEFLERLTAIIDEKNPDVAYGPNKHTRYNRTSFLEIKNEEDADDDDDEVDEKEYENWKEIFVDGYQYCFGHASKMGRITVLGKLIRRSIFVDNNIKFNEEQKFFADIRVMAEIANSAKTFEGDEFALYIKRVHNDKVNNPALHQFPLVEKFPYYMMAYRNAEAVTDNPEIKMVMHRVLAKFIARVVPRKYRGSEFDQWRNEFLDDLIEACSHIDKKELKKYDMKRYNRKLVKLFIKGDKAKIEKGITRVLIRRKLVKMATNKIQRNKTIALYVFNKMPLKENWVVFESFMGRNCSGQPKYVYRCLQEKYGDKFKCIWVVDRKGVAIEGKHKTCKRMSLRYYYYMNRSKYWVNNMRQPLSIPRREETIMLSTWHGTPLKRLVFDMDDVHSANPKYKQIVYKQTRGWDYLLSDNPFSTEKFQSCFLFEKEKILEYGYPANDPMYAPNRDELAAKIKEKLGIPKDKKVILYAPTWRDDNFYEAGQYGFDLALDIERMKKEFGDDYVLLLRLHYFIVDQLDLSKYPGFTYDGSSYDDITDLYLISDILITDYSSVFFDYSNLRRPILFYTYDLEKYRDMLRGFYLDVEKDLPGPLLITNDDVVDAIKNIDDINEKYKDRYDEFYDRFCCVDDGHASERVVEKVFG